MEGPKCVKCGRNLKNEQVFCQACLTSMEGYPVDPATPIHLPNRSQELRKAAPRKKALTPEEQIERQKKLIRWLSIVSLALVVSLVLCILILSQ